MLRIVHPAREGQGTRPPKGRRSAALFLTDQEVQHFRAALRNAARAYGSMVVLAGVIGVPVCTLRQTLHRRARPSAVLVLRVAEAAGMPVEAVLSGRLIPAGACPHCGAERRTA